MRAYTAIVGSPANRNDIQCFTGDGLFQRPVMEAKRYKLLPHLFLNDAVTVWLDSNIWLRCDVSEVVETLLGDADMALFRHPFRNTVWEEFATLKCDQRFAIPYLQQQLTAQRDSYLLDGLPDDAPLFECSIIIRRNKESVNRLMEAWWAHICRWQWRDQVSLPYVLWTHGKNVVVNDVVGNARDHPLFRHVEQWHTAKRA